MSKICSKCGMPLSDSVRICPYCHEKQLGQVDLTYLFVAIKWVFIAFLFTTPGFFIAWIGDNIWSYQSPDTIWATVIIVCVIVAGVVVYFKHEERKTPMILYAIVSGACALIMILWALIFGGSSFDVYGKAFPKVEQNERRDNHNNNAQRQGKRSRQDNPSVARDEKIDEEASVKESEKDSVKIVEGEVPPQEILDEQNFEGEVLDEPVTQ